MTEIKELTHGDYKVAYGESSDGWVGLAKHMEGEFTLYNHTFFSCESEEEIIKSIPAICERLDELSGKDREKTP